LTAAAAVVAAAALPMQGSASGAAAAATPRSPVEQWIRIELEEIEVHAVNAPRAARALALVSVAMYAAATRSRGEPFDRAAVAGAASRVLEYLLPGEKAQFRRLATVLAGSTPRRAQGLTLGRRIGGRVVARARQDRSSENWSGDAPSRPDVWVPTPPQQLEPLEPLAGTWRPWNLSSGSQFRPGAPPQPHTQRFSTELQEVYAVSRSLTAAQKRTADFWADGPGTPTPAGHWNLIAVELLQERRLSTLAAARLFAALNTAQADAFIACWDAKFEYWSMRPVTAVQRFLDPNWLPYLVTPPFPAYVSGHATTSGAASTVLAHFFPRHASRLRGLAEEAAQSRLYGGIHFRSDNEEGLRLGRRVGTTAVAALKSGFQWQRELMGADASIRRFALRGAGSR
jgi:membrane-associated phospholipid phosphatase